MDAWEYRKILPEMLGESSVWAGLDKDEGGKQKLNK